MSIKLVMVAPYPIDPSIIRGGVDAVVVYLMEGLKCIDELDIEVISIRNDIKKEMFKQFDNFKVHYIPSSKKFGNITLDIINKLKTKKKIEELRPDLIHVHNHSNYPYLYIKPYCVTITTVHGVTYKEVLYENETADWIRKYPRILLEKMVLNRTNYIIAVTPYVKGVIQHLTKGRIYVIENPVSRKYYNIQNNETANRILFVGSIKKLKNILDLIKAVNILKNEFMSIELRIAGNIEEPYYYNILKDYINKNNLVNNVKFLGHLSDNELYEEYSRSSVFALTSFEETSGMVIQQAMAAGKPVIATRAGGIPCIVEDGITGLLVEPGNLKDLADKIKLLFLDAELRVRLGKRGKLEAINRFQSEVVARNTYSLYKEVIAIENNLKKIQE